MTERYLPSWATAQEAADWLQAETGEPWPLPRLLESGVVPHIWLAPESQPEAGTLAVVFDGRHEGFLAPLVFAGDTHRLSVDRTGTLSMTRSPSGFLVRFTPPIPFGIGELRFPAEEVRQMAAHAHARAEPTPIAAEPLPLEDHSALATREKLIAAFGTHTGMSMAWFDNVTDTPALLKARKVDGVGARSKTREPLFCPWEVMLWLIDPKRKKGRRFHNVGTPWRLLERYFPASYAKHSADDPREEHAG